MQFSGTTYRAVLCCAMLFCKFGTFKISISHILENINHILGDIQTFLNCLSTPCTVSGKHLHDIIGIHTHTYSIIAKSSVDIDCELEIIYSNTAYVYVYNTMISSGTRCPVWTTSVHIPQGVCP